MRRVARCLLLLAALLASGGGVALEIRPPATVSALPGAYAVLPLQLAGEGTYDYVVSAPTPWVPLSSAGSVHVDGEGFMSVTVRVPRSALAGASVDVEVTFTSRDAPSVTARATLRVEVLALAAIEVIAPLELEGRTDEPLQFTIVVRNAGNQPDIVSLRAQQPMWSSRLEPSGLELDAGEEREVSVLLEPVGQVSSGYRMTVRFEATSQRDPEVGTRAVTRVVLLRAGGLGAAPDPGAPPSLTLSLRGGLGAGLSIADGVATGRVGYDLLPRVGGDLSDFVSGSAGIGGFGGDLDDPFRELPSRLDVALQGEGWNAAGGFGGGRYSLSGGTDVGDWRVAGGAFVSARDETFGYGVSAFASSQRPDLDLQVSARISDAGDGRTDSLGARYRTPLGDGVTLTVGADVVGNDGPDGYRVQPAVRESITWQAPAFDLTQSYSGLPLAGLHAIAISGGTRLLDPISVRASSSLQLTPDDARWRHALSLAARPAPGLGTTLTASIQSSAAAASWTVRPAATYRFAGDGWSGSLAASYGYTGALRGEPATGSVARASTTLRLSDLSVGAAATYDLRSSPDGGERSLELDADAGYRLGSAATLEAGLRYRLEYAGDPIPIDTEVRLQAAWQQRWTSDVSSRLAYSQSVRSGGASAPRSERLSLVVSARDVGIAGLGLSAGYAASSTTGLLTGIAPIRHELSIRAAYTLLLPFETPAPIVELFGGRRGATVEGVVFLDQDLDGVRSASERGLAGVTVRIGGEEAVTDDDGRYRLRVPAGQQRVGVAGGLPAAVAARGPTSVEVVDGVDQRLDLPFVPVVTLPVRLFDDRDGDGAPGSDEPGIAFGGVVIEGPMQLAVRLDARGTADVTGLVPGRYTVRPDPERLPPRYRVTTEPVSVTLREGERPARVLVGAGAPPRTTLTTFTGVELAVIVRAEPMRLSPGADVAVQALVSGPAERVVAVSIDGSEHELRQEGTRWTGVVRLPRTAPTGAATLVVRAEAADTQTEAAAQLTLVERPLAQAERVIARIGEDVTIRVTTEFAAEDVIVEVAGAQVTLESADGYRWSGTWSVAPSALEHAPVAEDDGSRRVLGRIVVDGEALAEAPVELRDVEE